ncbi:MAG: hypothetical protein EZS28_055157, partial [Streblomastix strix]
MEAVAKALHPDSKEKRFKSESIISISREYLVQVLELPFDSKSRKMTELLKTFEGLDITKYANINYYRGLQVMYQSEETIGLSSANQNEVIKTIDILIVESIYDTE